MYNVCYEGNGDECWQCGCSLDGATYYDIVAHRPGAHALVQRMCEPCMVSSKVVQLEHVSEESWELDK